MQKKRAGRALSPVLADDDRDDRDGRPRGSFPIVGIGASAGGLEAFSALLSHLPLDTGMSFVLVQHLDPEHDSALAQLLGRATSLPVHEATDNLRVEPNHVYVIPPDRNLSITAGVLTLGARARARAPHRTIDVFLQSLAADRSERAIGVILSGTASDGTLGLQAIKAEGGITFAQDESARYDSMPRSAVAAGCVDFVLSPEDIANELARIAKHPALAAAGSGSTGRSGGNPGFATTHPDVGTGKPSGRRGRVPSGMPANAPEATAEVGPVRHIGSREKARLKEITLLLRDHCGVDFSLYKSSTIQRRITRRMVLTKHDTLESYAEFLRGNGKELDTLYSDVLISVTGFFRDPDAFDVLQQDVWPALLRRPSDEPLRVWTLGCSTGQEAYSIAMSFVEAAEKATRTRLLQVFATDLNEALLDKARHGLYARTVAEDLPPDRLRRFFVEEEGGYQVSKAVREMVVFARQNVISDPPFSRMDLISCRNLLIYFEPALQDKVFPVFHYALKPGGFLWLGASESVGGFTELFQPLDKKHKIYLKRAAPTPALQLPSSKDRGDPSRRVRQGSGLHQLYDEHGATADGFRGELSAQREADRVALNQFAPPAVLINAELQILQFRGPTGAYLQPPSGKASFDLLKMARSGLLLPLRGAIEQAKQENTIARREHVRIEGDGESSIVNVEVIPLKNLREPCFLVVFEPAGAGSAAARQAPRGGPRLPAPARADRTSPEGQSRRIAELEAELVEMREYVQSLREQHEAAKEELQAFNEEVQSANEELQSVNEELETSKEELESANEELTTVNDELAHRNTELTRLNSDLVNIETSAHVAIALLGRDLTIRRFSVEAERQLNLVPADVGRRLSSVRHHLDVPDLEPFVTGVIDTARARERQVQDRHGRWFSLRVRPYLTLSGEVDGAVLVLVDIGDLKLSEQAIAAARDYADVIIETVREPLLVLRDDLRIERANRAFYEWFRVTPAEIMDKVLYDLGSREWDLPALRRVLDAILVGNQAGGECSIERQFDKLGRRTVLLNARRMRDGGAQPQRILLAMEDITERQLAEDARRQLAAIVDSSGDAIVSADTNGVIATWNAGAERLFGYTAAEAVGQPASMLTPPERRDEQSRILERVRRGEGTSDHETVRRHKDGRLIDISLTVSPVKDAAGRIHGASTIARDITERRHAVEALRQSHAELLLDAEELMRFNRIAVGRELRMIELKREVNDLRRQQGEPAPYPLDVQQNAEETDV